MSVARGHQQPRRARSKATPAPRRARLASVPAGLLVPQPTDWARDRIAAGRAAGEVPDYGSPAWLALAEEDPRKLAAALVYAEVQRFEELTLAERLHAEIAEARYVAECAELEDAVEAGARAAMARDEENAAGCARLAEHGAAQLLGKRPTAAALAIRQGDVARAARIDRQRDRAAALPPLEELMRRPVHAAVVD